MNKPLLNKLNKDLKFVYSDNDTLSIIFSNNEILMGVVGEFNKNLQELEKVTSCNLYSRGNSILIKSNTELTERLIVQKIGLPCFIKPNGSGSSYGISKVKKRSDFNFFVFQIFHQLILLFLEKKAKKYPQFRNFLYCILYQ